MVTKCPFCAEEIQTEAIKCKHCGEFLKKISAQHVSDITIPERRKPISTSAAIVLFLLVIFFLPILLESIFKPNGTSGSNTSIQSPIASARPNDARPTATAQQQAEMANMKDGNLLNAAQKLLAPTNIKSIPVASEDKAAMYLREFDRRHPNSKDARAVRLANRLAGITIQRNMMQSLAALDSNPPTDEAEVMCRVMVKQNLKAPSTAEFQNYAQDYVKYLGQGKFHIQTKADAQNSFGAKIRSTFDCKVQCLDKEHCTVTKLEEF